ncbi:I78 family peptidase inhibitor [Algirhabdus cladophorae]|uniref:I78 family peptidase inhibitor n=1 Tax=Algirhabdus cladophorae TaxID=3377108 RepID=UPI003B84988C
MKKFLFLAAFGLLTACGPKTPVIDPIEPVEPTDPAEAALPVGLDDQCKANENAQLLGMTTDGLEETLVLLPTRIIRPGDLVTQDYRPQRLNIHLDAAGTVIRLSCG